MNARTSRLIARVARLHWLNDPRDPRQPEASVLAGLKKAWERTPSARREAVRWEMVRTANVLIDIMKSKPR